MRRNTPRNQLLMMILVVGFFVGILYENFSETIHFFKTEQLLRLREMNFQSKEYLLYIMKMRMLPLIGALFLWNFRWRKIVVLMVSGWCSFFLGRILVAAILAHGVKGILLSMGALLPHTIFYVLLYFIIILQVYDERRRKWKQIQIAAIIILLVLGIGSEVYINPNVLKRIIDWM